MNSTSINKSSLLSLFRYTKHGTKQSMEKISMTVHDLVKFLRTVQNVGFSFPDDDDDEGVLFLLSSK